MTSARNDLQNVEDATDGAPDDMFAPTPGSVPKIRDHGPGKCEVATCDRDRYFFEKAKRHAPVCAAHSLDRVLTALASDVFDMSDEEIEAELVAEGVDVKAFAERVRARIESALKGKS